MISKMKDAPGLEPPEDKSVTTLYVGGVTESIAEKDLRDEFYAYGEIKDIRMAPKNNCTFVTYTTREGAEEAASKLANRITVNGVKLKLMWGKPKVRADPSHGSAGGAPVMAGPVGGSSAALTMPPGAQPPAPAAAAAGEGYK